MQMPSSLSLSLRLHKVLTLIFALTQVAEPQAQYWSSAKVEGLSDIKLVAINNENVVAGYGMTSQSNWMAFKWASGTLQALGTLNGASESFSIDINERGDVLGTSGGRIFVTSHGVMAEVPTPGGKVWWARALNGLGDFVGGFRSATEQAVPNASYAFVFGSSGFRDISGGRRSEALDIGPDGTVVGWIVENDWDGGGHAFAVRKPAIMQPGETALRTLSGIPTHGQLVSVNANGFTAGWVIESNVVTTFVREPFKHLPEFIDRFQVTAMNSHGHLIGEITPSTGGGIPAIYSPRQKTLRRISQVILPPDTLGSIGYVRALNDSLHVAVESRTSPSQWEAFVLLPPPSSSPRLLSPRSSAAGFHVTGIGEAGQAFSLEASIDLKNWTPMLGVHDGKTNNASEFLDADAKVFNRRNYRLRLIEP